MATDFLTATGTNGFITSSAVTMFSSGTTTINALTNASLAVSTTVFTQTNTAQGLIGYVQVTLGTTWGPATAGGNIAGWWLFSPDGGSTYETTLTARPPDWIVPLSTSLGAAASQVVVSPLVNMPWSSFKVLVQNNSGATLGSSSVSATFQTVAVQY